MNSEHGTRRRITTTMVAERAGVSQPTVSRVINNPGVVGVETANRVQQAIQELGYVHPSALLRPIEELIFKRKHLECIQRRKQVTALMVAERAGVSPATVSRVLNKRLVHAKTIERVREAISELGFSYSAPVVRRQSTTPKGNIAFLVPCDKLKYMTHTPLLNGVLHGIVSALSEKGLNLIQNTFRNFATLLAKQQIDGVIVWPHLQGVDNSTLDMLRSYPLVYVMSMQEDRLNGDRVKPNQRRTGELAAQYLLERGHRNVACITTSRLETWLSERSQAFLTTATSSGLAETQPVLETVDWNEDMENIESFAALDVVLARGIQRLLHSVPRPTGWFVTSDALTAHVYRHLKQRGIAIGIDIEIVSCNNEVPILNCLDPRPKSIDVHAEEIGRKTLEQLLRRIQEPASGSYFCVEVEPHLY